MRSSTITRRSFFTAGAALSAVVLAACDAQNNDNQASGQGSSESSTPRPTGEGVYTRDSDGFHLNSKSQTPTVTLYSDFQCPYCAKADPTYMQVANELDGVMNVTVKNFPLPMHANAVPAAQAVEAAEIQGKHVEMGEKIFQTQQDWEEKSQADAVKVYEGYAEELGLDLEKFRSDANSDAVKQIIERDFQAGRNAGVSGTPQWVVGGKVVEGVESSTSKDDMISAFKKAAGI